MHLITFKHSKLYVAWSKEQNTLSRAGIDEGVISVCVIDMRVWEGALAGDPMGSPGLGGVAVQVWASE